MSAWKACDIRGPYPSEVNADLIRFAANAIASLLTTPARLMVAGDFRTSTPELLKAAVEGASQAGVEVLDGGQIPTPVAYFAHHRYGTGAVLIVTASHNPSSHNGLKFMIGHLPPSPEELSGLRDRKWHRSAEGRRHRETGPASGIRGLDTGPLETHPVWYRAIGRLGRRQWRVVRDRTQNLRRTRL